MKTYQITYWQTIYETVEVEAKDEDEAMEIFNDGDSKIISSKIKTYRRLNNESRSRGIY
jgi:hypothetical protein